MTRYKSASESAEKVEDELKVEKRKLQREVDTHTSYFSYAFSNVPLSTRAHLCLLLVL